MPYAEPGAGFDGEPHRVDARLVARHTRHVATVSPTPVAIHDDGNMGGQSSGVDRLGKQPVRPAGLQHVEQSLHVTFSWYRKQRRLPEEPRQLRNCRSFRLRLTRCDRRCRGRVHAAELLLQKCHVAERLAAGPSPVHTPLLVDEDCRVDLHLLEIVVGPKARVLAAFSSERSARPAARASSGSPRFRTACSD